MTPPWRPAGLADVHVRASQDPSSPRGKLTGTPLVNPGYPATYRQSEEEKRGQAFKRSGEKVSNKLQQQGRTSRGCHMSYRVSGICDI